jgi:RNA polymerase sigma factor (sigma-70 family)
MSLQPSASYSETELIHALKEHKNEAYRYLYMHYRGSLYTVITQIIPDTETANDVLQEVFIAVWKNIDKYDAAKGRLFTWLLNITRNTAINKTRSKNYKNFLKNEGIDNYVNSFEENGVYRTKIDQIGLRKEVSLLKEHYKTVLELSYFNGFTQEEIAKALNIPLGTVKTRLRSAIIELRKQFS